MNQKLTNWQQELDNEAVDEYNALRRSLQRNNGFGLFFVQCSLAVGENIIAAIQEDIGQKKVEILGIESENSEVTEQHVGLRFLDEGYITLSLDEEIMQQRVLIFCINF